jgi:putative sigma-54 modulation protein
VSAITGVRVPFNLQTITEVLDMQLDITGHQLEVTEPIKNYIDTKFERIKRHFDQVMSVHVILSVEKIRHKSEATMHIGGKDFFAESTEDHLYKSIDALVDKLDKQIRRHKSKLNNYNNKEALAINRTQY